MKEIKLTQGKVAIVDDEDYEHLRQFKWYPLRAGGTIYVRRYCGRVNGKQKQLLMHREIMDTPEGESTDHINHNGLDNRKENLRICTVSENMCNRGAQSNNTTGYKGVFKYSVTYNGKTYSYMTAAIRHNSKLMGLGYFKTAEEAAKAYNKAALKYHGEFAKLNIL